MKYRFLGQGETIEAGDEYLPSVVMKWMPTERVGARVSSLAASQQRYRRNVEDVKESGGGR